MDTRPVLLAATRKSPLITPCLPPPSTSSLSLNSSHLSLSRLLFFLIHPSTHPSCLSVCTPLSNTHINPCLVGHRLHRTNIASHNSTDPPSAARQQPTANPHHSSLTLTRLLGSLISTPSRISPSVRSSNQSATATATSICIYISKKRAIHPPAAVQDWLVSPNENLHPQQTRVCRPRDIPPPSTTSTAGILLPETPPAFSTA